MERNNFDDFKFRASAIGKIMTESRTKEPLGETVKKYLLEVYVREIHGRDKEIISKYISKGLQVEELSLTLYSRVKKEFYKKNELGYSNEFITGTPDIITNDSIVDIKSSWSMHTFYDVFTSKINKMYLYQLQSYMALTGKKKAVLAYCLVDTPQMLINDEIRKLQWQMGLSDPEQSKVYKAAVEYLEFSMKYEDVPMKKRYIEFEIEFDEELMSAVYQRVKECREFLNKLLLR